MGQRTPSHYLLDAKVQAMGKPRGLKNSTNMLDGARETK
jgi:hypothetical protein